MRKRRKAGTVAKPPIVKKMLPYWNKRTLRQGRNHTSIGVNKGTTYFSSKCVPTEGREE